MINAGEMINAGKILLTGGSGRLGRELQTLLTGISAPPSTELDISNAGSVEAAFKKYAPKLVVHAAAYTNVLKAETDREACWRVNVEGTRNIICAALKNDIPVVHISTDYVFWGDTGNYSEGDTPGPVRNYYSLTKLAAEQFPVLLKEFLIIRTSFRPREFQYPVAFKDVFTSQDYVDVIAPDVALAILNFKKIGSGILHIGTERKSVYELARRRKPDVGAAFKKDAGVELPDDISLNCEKWNSLKKSFENL
jgi:dTDP-4-dehydrorhamnose reductase